MDIERQRRLFQMALDELQGMDDLVNQALEVYELDTGEVSIVVYEIHAPL